MGTIGYGYGSEWHLLRYLGYHRDYLSQKVLEITNGNAINWLDFKFSQENKPLKDDKEFLGLEFIQDNEVQNKWKNFWPQTGNPQNWDAVGKIIYENHFEWLLVEAKSHINELKSCCGAKSKESQKKIRSALYKASQEYGNTNKPIENWLKPYYQFANRLAVLHFLQNECNPPENANLLFVYFCGENRENLVCPKNTQEWMPVIEDMNNWLGINKNCDLKQKIHYLFLHVNPSNNKTRIMTK